MSDANGQIEPPMEEILASIRRIISEDEKEETDLENDDLAAANLEDDFDPDHPEQDTLELSDTLDLTDIQYPRELAELPIEETLEMDEEGVDDALVLTERIEEDYQIAVLESDETDSSLMHEFEKNDHSLSEVDLLMTSRSKSQKPLPSEDNISQNNVLEHIEQNLAEQVDVSDVIDEISVSVVDLQSELGQDGAVETLSVFDTAAKASDSIIDTFVTQNNQTSQIISNTHKDQEDTAMEEHLMSDASASSSAAAFAALAKAAQEKEVSSAPKQEMPDIVMSNQSLDRLVSEMLRPILKEWLDKNLPAMVDNIVKKEIKRLTAGH